MNDIKKTTMEDVLRENLEDMRIHTAHVMAALGFAMEAVAHEKEKVVTFDTEFVAAFTVGLNMFMDIEPEHLDEALHSAIEGVKQLTEEKTH